MTTQDKLAEALLERIQKAWEAHSEDGKVSISMRDAMELCEQVLPTVIQQAQPPAASATPNLASYWRIVAEAAEVLQMVLDSGVKLPPNWRGPLLDELSGLSAMMLAAALQPQAVQPVAWVNPDDLHNPNFVGVNAVKVGHEGLGKHYTLPLYTHPQPAQDAALYQELLMAVSKKFPNESRHETALRYIKQNELQSCEPKCDAAMAKESGNGCALTLEVSRENERSE